MGKWERKKLGDIGEGYIGLTYSPTEVSDTGTIVLRSGNIQDNKLDLTDVVRVNKKISEKLTVKNGYILICSRNGSSSLVGKSAFITKLDEEMTFGAFMMIYKSDYNPFLIHYFHSNFFRLQLGKSATTTINQITKKMLEEIEVPFPPLETQKQITKTLNTTAELLAMRKQQLKELDNLIKSVFYDMFGDPATNDKMWEVKTIAEITEHKLSYGSGASAINYDGTTRYIRITDINDAGYLNEDIVSPSEISDKYFLNDGDILFARSGATVGKTLRYRNIFGKSIYAGYLIRLIPNKSLIDPDYVYYFTKTDYYKGFIESNIKTVAQPNINAQQYGDLKILVPPLSLQTKFATIVTKIEEQKALVKKAIDETQHLFDSLMSEYFD